MDAYTPHTAADPVEFYGTQVNSRLLLGTAQYPSPAILAEAIRASAAEIVTVSLRRESGAAKAGQSEPGKALAGQSFWQLIRDLGVKVLPNTAGCKTVKEAVTTAEMARELFDTPWIKLEVIGEDDTLQPDVFGLVEAARILTRDGFQVFPYTTDDLIVADKLLAAGCEVLMPWGAPIGSGRGLNNPYGLRSMRAHFPRVPLVVDAGVGLPSHAAAAMEFGYDAVLLNTAVAKAGDPVKMARAFALAIEAGREGFRADPMEARDMAAPSTPVMGQAHFG
ncbi:thiazole synthase [Ancylobacter defluvii]|uniref:Thiazole synthase n=1 Tax=Ancylobacter defluvii TaxID=1282440 RepID=A0A9W6K109_9HYPH|nr:thiazole synthase [Ancylobacter defluvii]MBS7588402.1 thiazole synthase [Ancylobacter defluvii]GLK86807.1 thiazole synthase [Ancylobacter defluvii]